MKKVIINILLIITFIFIYLLQENLFTHFTIAGVMPNIFIILVLFIGLFIGRSIGAIYGIIFGAFLDLWIGRNFGITSIGLAIIGIIGGILDKNFSKDSRITIIIMCVITTIIYETLIYALNCIILSINVEILQFVKILLIEAIYNAIIITILYPLIKKAGYDIEEEFKGNRILTRYF